MKLNKKNPKKQIEKFSNVFMQLGLVLALFVVFISLEHRTKQVAFILPELEQNNDDVYVLDDTPIIFKKEVVKPKINVPEKRSTILTVIEKSDNDDAKVIESIIEPVIENPTPVLDPDKIIEVVEPTEIIEDVPFTSVQNKPVFKGCEGLSEEENAKCFDRKIRKLIQRHFNASLASELGLSSGKKRISTQFIINKEGNVTDIKVRAPHPKLKKEAQRIVNKIPKFTPGRQNGKAVKVRYTLPITFNVE